MVRDILIDFAIPAILIIGCFTLLILGIDGEVKTVLIMAAGWVFHSGYKRNRGS